MSGPLFETVALKSLSCIVIVIVVLSAHNHACFFPKHCSFVFLVWCVCIVTFLFLLPCAAFNVVRMNKFDGSESARIPPAIDNFLGGYQYAGRASASSGGITPSWKRMFYIWIITNAMLGSARGSMLHLVVNHECFRTAFFSVSSLFFAFGSPCLEACMNTALSSTSQLVWNI